VKRDFVDPRRAADDRGKRRDALRAVARWSALHESSRQRGKKIRRPDEGWVPARKEISEVRLGERGDAGPVQR
jgi:hypothetical protein